MSDGNRIIKIHVMDDGTWVVNFKGNSENVWKVVSEYFSKKEGYTIQDEYHRIWAKTLGQLIDVTQKTSDELRK